MVPGRPRVAVVGAGIAGLTIATLLRRRGVHCALFERASTVATVGAGIQLSPNGVRILRRLGLAATLAERGVAARSIETRRWDDGTLLAQVPHGAACEAVYGAPYYLIHRADLQEGLLALLPDREIQLGLRVTWTVEHPDGALLHFADGSIASADVVIGADGVHSVVRAAVVRDEPRFSGYSVYRGLVPATAVPSFTDDPRVMFWLGPRRHITYYPVAAQRTVHFSAVFATPDPDPDPPATGAAELASAFDGWHPQVRRVLGAAASVTRWGLFDRDLAERYCTARIALIGDAAHPMLPYLSQGANQALEDAVVLADCLAGAGSGADAIAGALRRYQTLRRPRTGEVHRQSRLRAERFHLTDGPEQLDRDLALGQHQDLHHLDWLYGFEPQPVGVIQ